MREGCKTINESSTMTILFGIVGSTWKKTAWDQKEGCCYPVASCIVLTSQTSREVQEHLDSNCFAESSSCLRYQGMAYTVYGTSIGTDFKEQSGTIPWLRCGVACHSSGKGAGSLVQGFAKASQFNRIAPLWIVFRRCQRFQRTAS